jgi:hypothetical protein
MLRKEMLEHAGKGLFWGQTSGPGAHGTSRMAHQQFDRLACIEPTKRSREDRLPLSLLATIERWLDESGADELAQWSHAYLAHAGGPEARRRIADLLVTADKITDAIKALALLDVLLFPLLGRHRRRSSGPSGAGAYEVRDHADQQSYVDRSCAVRIRGQTGTATRASLEATMQAATRFLLLSILIALGLTAQLKST